MWLKFAPQYRHTPLCHISIFSCRSNTAPLGTLIVYHIPLYFAIVFLKLFQLFFSLPDTSFPCLCYFFNNYSPFFSLISQRAARIQSLLVVPPTKYKPWISLVSCSGSFHYRMTTITVPTSSGSYAPEKLRGHPSSSKLRLQAMPIM